MIAKAQTIVILGITILAWTFYPVFMLISTLVSLATNMLVQKIINNKIDKALYHNTNTPRQTDYKVIS